MELEGHREIINHKSQSLLYFVLLILFVVYFTHYYAENQTLSEKISFIRRLLFLLLTLEAGIITNENGIYQEDKLYHL
jgi:hypothetical protein